MALKGLKVSAKLMCILALSHICCIFQGKLCAQNYMGLYSVQGKPRMPEDRISVKVGRTSSAAWYSLVLIFSQCDCIFNSPGDSLGKEVDQCIFEQNFAGSFSTTWGPFFPAFKGKSA